MELALFQLENLLLSPNRFLFFDLRSDPVSLAGPIQTLLTKARGVSRAEILQCLRSEKFPPDHPIVLVCENGAVSTQVAGELETAGFQQVYVVAGGVSGLLSEL